MGEKHIWATETGVQCSKHEVAHYDFEFEYEYLEAQVPLCIKCFACQKCEPDTPCKTEGGDA